MKHAMMVMVSCAFLWWPAANAHSELLAASDAAPDRSAHEAPSNQDAPQESAPAGPSDDVQAPTVDTSEDSASDDDSQSESVDRFGGFSTYEDALSHAENAFAFGDYDTVIQTLKPWLYPHPVQDGTAQNIANGYALLGASAWFVDAIKDTEKYFTAGLYQQPTLTLDPLVFPPALISFFQDLRKKLDLHEEEHVNEGEHTLYIESRITEHPIWVSMLPFGYGMFVNERPEWGVVYALTEGALLTVSTGMFWANYAQRQPSDDPEHPMGYEDPQRAKMRKRVHIGTGAAFLGVVLVNIIHGAIVHKQTQQVQYRTLSSPPEGFDSTEHSKRSRRSEQNQRRWNLQIGPYSNTLGAP